MAINDADLIGPKRDAYEALADLFRTYGLDTLAPQILQMVQNGFSNDTITIKLQESKEYRERFAANETRRKAGLPVLSPAEYIATERSYQQILSAAGVPKGFYDSHTDFTGWLSKDVAPQEIKERVDIATEKVNSSDPYYKAAWADAGLGTGDAIAATLDQKRALPLLQKRVQMARVGSEAMRRGLHSDMGRNEYFVDQGITRDQAASAYSRISEFLPDAAKLGQIYGSAYDQRTAEDELLSGSGEAARKRKSLGEKETASFSGTAGTNARSLTKRTGGKY